MQHMNSQQYWTSISILLNNHHAINHKLFASIIHEVVAIPKGIQQVKTNGMEAVNQRTIDKYMLMHHLKHAIQGRPHEFEGIIVYFKCLLKKGEKSLDAIGLLDFITTSYRHTFECNAFDDFEVKLQDDNIIHIQMLNVRADTEPNYRWAEYVLRPRLMKWSRVYDSSIDVETIFANANSSLRLVDICKYNTKYREFKAKYSEKALKLWKDAKESTDPLKFIYEDLGIAAYLIILWQSNSNVNSPKAFADLGCGNGLLVYILIEEGYRGYGYDIRSRKLWSLYPSNVAQHLIEQPVEPFKFKLPADVDWLIGNHSDELSPWLPVLAATLDYQMSYFLLPCCAYEFSGKKFQRRNSSISTFKDFCNYAELISIRCGFVTEKDRLKIPSTKRLVFVGRNRKYSLPQHVQVVKEIMEFVKSEQKHYTLGGHLEINLRNKEEAVKNCTQIDKSIINGLVLKIFHLLLDDPHTDSAVDVSNEWRSGKPMAMSDIVQHLDKPDLVQIKSECGGLKTLLRNKHEIFELQKPDIVTIRKPQVRNIAKGKTITLKKRACFFYENHPQGCPLSNDQCTFLH